MTARSCPCRPRSRRGATSSPGASRPAQVTACRSTSGRSTGTLGRRPRTSWNGCARTSVAGRRPWRGAALAVSVEPVEPAARDRRDGRGRPRYDVDGVHFDYIRYPDGDHCYCDGCRRGSRRRSGAASPGGRSDVLEGGPHRRAWLDRRQGNITLVVKAVSAGPGDQAAGQAFRGRIPQLARRPRRRGPGLEALVRPRLPRLRLPDGLHREQCPVRQLGDSPEGLGGKGRLLPRDRQLHHAARPRDRADPHHATPRHARLHRVQLRRRSRADALAAPGHGHHPEAGQPGPGASTSRPRERNAGR